MCGFLQFLVHSSVLYLPVPSIHSTTVRLCDRCSKGGEKDGEGEEPASAVCHTAEHCLYISLFKGVSSIRWAFHGVKNCEQ